MRAHLDIAHTGTLIDDSRVQMQIDSESTAFLMSILTDLYSDPELAVIREYSTNAIDSHRAAGNPAPIEVELPTALRPLFIVRDHGIGMSVNDITNNFSKYGWSSKRDSDTEVGMLGLGCKSGLTYSSQFTFVATKDGVRATVLVTREASGAGAIQIIDTVGTDAPNGVEVQIPTSNAGSFCFRAERFFRFWERGTVLVNGKAPEHIKDGSDVLEVDDDVILTQGLDSNYIVMGNVAYPLSAVGRFTGYTRANVVAWVPIGAVDFTPSREALHLTKRTKDVISSLNEFLEGALTRVIKADIESAPNHWEALQLHRKWSDSYPVSGSYFYKGDKIPTRGFRVNKEASLRWVGPSIELPSSRPETLWIQDAEKSLFLVGHNGRALVRSDKERLVKWMNDQGIPVHTSVVAMPTMVGSPWFDAKARIVHLDELRKIQVDTKRAAGTAPDGRYRVLDNNGDLTRVTDLKSTIVWVPAGASVSRMNLMRFFRRFSDLSVVPLPKNQEAKFLKTHPTAINYITFVEAISYCFSLKMTEADSAKISIQYEVHGTNVQSLWDVRDRLLDPALKDLVNECGPRDGNSTMQDGYHALQQVCYMLNVNAPRLKDSSDFVKRLKATKTTYPLLHHLPSVYSFRKDLGEDVLRYINLLYLHSI